jgi:hypothetical protein
MRIQFNKIRRIGKIILRAQAAPDFDSRIGLAKNLIRARFSAWP